MKTLSSDLRQLAQHGYFPSPHAAQPAWNLAEVAGRLCEFDESSGSTALTWLTRLVYEAQQQKQPVAWVSEAQRNFFPPDVALHGIDLQALVVIRLPDLGRLPRAANELLRSGAFGLVIFDLGKSDIAMPLQSRLLGAAQKHHTAVVFLAERAAQDPSLSSLISLRLASRWHAVAEGNFICHLRACKDKRRAPNWEIEEVFRGPLGLRSYCGAAASTFAQEPSRLERAASRGGR